MKQSWACDSEENLERKNTESILLIGLVLKFCYVLQWNINSNTYLNDSLIHT